MKRILVFVGVLAVAAGAVTASWFLLSDRDAATSAIRVPAVSLEKRCVLFAPTAPGASLWGYNVIAGSSDCSADSQYLGYDTNGDGRWSPFTGDAFRPGLCRVVGQSPSSDTTMSYYECTNDFKWDSWQTLEPQGARCRISKSTINQGCVPY